MAHKKLKPEFIPYIILILLILANFHFYPPCSWEHKCILFNHVVGMAHSISHGIHSRKGQCCPVVVVVVVAAAAVVVGIGHSSANRRAGRCGWAHRCEHLELLQLCWRMKAAPEVDRETVGSAADGAAGGPTTTMGCRGCWKKSWCCCTVAFARVVVVVAAASALMLKMTLLLMSSSSTRCL
jgi:hypothetical protein